ncbi:MAG: hypothetical protein LC126_30080 [Bryobacterales bacterium]|nr:hypothetical protein [Bryobacterales bacterium]
MDAIWFYAARESGSIVAANRLIDGITDRTWLLGQYPQIGRRRDHDLRPRLRSFGLENTSSFIALKARTRSFFTSSTAAATYKT